MEALAHANCTTNDRAAPLSAGGVDPGRPRLAGRDIGRGDPGGGRSAPRILWRPKHGPSDSGAALGDIRALDVTTKALRGSRMAIRSPVWRGHEAPAARPRLRGASAGVPRGRGAVRPGVPALGRRSVSIRREDPGAQGSRFTAGRYKPGPRARVHRQSCGGDRHTPVPIRRPATRRCRNPLNGGRPSRRSCAGSRGLPNRAAAADLDCRSGGRGARRSRPSHPAQPSRARRATRCSASGRPDRR